MTEKDIFVDYLKQQGLKFTKQREEILNFFLKEEKHLSPEEMFDILRKKRLPLKIGRATVYRTLKLLSECGLAEKVDFGDGLNRKVITLFEHKFAHPHHDHLICLSCGKSFEFSNPEIEKLQENVARGHQFKVAYHRLKIYGYCKKCQSTKK
ncbi:MAG TPA: transcriptional repressor [Elusimicrobia bacterium]|jgi:Fur family ferric uptake transcriptional regulator|nr:transcriptional repressor [Elusimicrobiota bacterium]